MIRQTRRSSLPSKPGKCPTPSSRAVGSSHFLFLRSRAPLSILNVKFGQPVELRVAQRQSEPYQPPPKQPAKPFSGAGNRLGSPAPDGITHASSASTAMPGGFSNVPAPATAVPPLGDVKMQVDESKPTTNVQVRLADGTKWVARPVYGVSLD